MPSENAPHVIGDGQMMQCRSWEDLISWAREPERHSCYEMISDYVPIVHRLEQYAFCPEESPHYETMRRYFEIHGHKNVFEDDVEDDGVKGKGY